MTGFLTESMDEEQDMSLSSPDDSIATDTSSNVSQLITDEDFVQSLFLTCDQENTGKVPCSIIIKFLCNINECHQQIEELRKLLDPDNVDAAVALPQMQSCFDLWVENIRKQDNLDNGEKLLQISPIVTPSTPCTIRGSTSSTPLIPSPEVKYEISQDDTEVNDWRDQNESLQLAFHREKEINSRLQQDFEASEEALTVSRQKIEDLEATVKSNQKTSERLRELQWENCELRSTLAVLEDANKNLKYQVKTKSDADHVPREHLIESQEQLAQLSSRADLYHQENEKLRGELSDIKAVHAESQQRAAVDMAGLQDQFDEATSCVEELKLLLKGIRVEKSNMELKLAHTQKQLQDAEIKMSLMEDGQRPGTVSTGDSDDEEPMPVMPLCGSTPIKNPSLCSELRDKILGEDNLPSPLCDKEFEDLMFTVPEAGPDAGILRDEMVTFFRTITDDEPDMFASECPSGTSAIEYVATETDETCMDVEAVSASEEDQGQSFISDQGFISDGITSSSSLASRRLSLPPLKLDGIFNNTFVKENQSSSVKQKLALEIGSFADRLSRAAVSNQVANRRIIRLTRVIRDMKEQHEEAIARVKQESADLIAMLERQLEEVNKQLDDEVSAKNEALQELQLTKDTLREAEDEAEYQKLLVEKLEENKASLEDKVESLTRCILQMSGAFPAGAVAKMLNSNR